MSKESVIQYVNHVASSPKVAAAVSGAAISGGISTYMEWLSRGLGIAVSITGIIVAITVIRKGAVEREKGIIDKKNAQLFQEKLLLEIEALKNKGN
jgi:hypothetical protein